MFSNSSLGIFEIETQAARLPIVVYNNLNNFKADFCGVRACTVTRSAGSRPSSAPISFNVLPSPAKALLSFIKLNNSSSHSTTAAVGLAEVKIKQYL